MPLLPDFVPPCLPTKAPRPPTGELWLHEIKHDGFRIIARKEGDRVCLYSRVGNDLTHRFPLVVEALASLRSRSVILDGEAVACDDNGISNFDRLRHRRHDASVFLYAFDLIELNGDDLRREPLDVRKATLASVLAKADHGVRLNEHIDAAGLDLVVAVREGTTAWRTEVDGPVLNPSSPSDRSVTRASATPCRWAGERRQWRCDRIHGVPPTRDDDPNPVFVIGRETDLHSQVIRRLKECRY